MPSIKEYVERPPRLQPVLPKGVVDIPAPPANDSNDQSLVRLVALPLITVGGFLLVSLLGGQGGGSSLLRMLTILPMGLAAVVTSTIAWKDWRKKQRDNQQRTENYLLQLSDLRRQMQLQHQQQREYYLYNYPNPEVTLGILTDGDSSLNSRLWERRSTDSDFGSLRLGFGNRTSTVIYQVQNANAADSDHLTQEAQRLAHDSQTLSHVPILLNLFQHSEAESGQKSSHQQEKVNFSDLVFHAIGISGKAQEVYPAINTMLAELVAFHSPAEANILLVAPSSASSAWSWIRPLPHCPPARRRDQRLSYPICFEEVPLSSGNSRVKSFWRYLRDELERREMRLQDQDAKFNRLPFLLIVVDLLDVTDPLNTDVTNSALKDLESEAAIEKLIQSGNALGTAVIFLASDRVGLPSQCQVVLEIANTTTDTSPAFRLAVVGNDSIRLRGHSDQIDMTKLAQYALSLSKLNVRLAYGQDIPAGYGFMEMFGGQTLDDLQISSYWEKSLEPETADWMAGLVGVMSGGEVRELRYSADRDGVHGMVAGSTGSGKSELLMTLILGLAVRHDPSVINFVLVDFKGGAAFEPFRNLPHCVDIVTNLEGNAVERMFAAINAELNRRQEINRRDEVKHIVQYRQKGYHLDPNRPPYPHLFIFIDEFAEMIAGNAEYKQQLDSITRLGRALGVSLILAAQRPTGVTDQMRANIKFRICLRVETREESGEMLRRPEAAYLPAGVAGRGYLQIGNENIEMIQVAYSGEDYLHNLSDEEMPNDQAAALDRDIVWLKRLGQKFQAPKLFEVLVVEMNRLVRESGAAQQKKPWPSPLPKVLGLADVIPETEYIPSSDLSFLEGTKGASNAYFHETIRNWLDGAKPTWQAIDWSKKAMHAVIGLIDDPFNAAYRMLRMNLQTGHIAVFGTSGSGKSTLLRTIALGLAAVHTPETLHLYLVDFGNRSLDVLNILPHTGAFITANEQERLQRLLHFLTETIEKRKQILAAARVNSLYSYNQTNPHLALPSILVFIDNFAEFKESFEDYLVTLTSLIRDGLANGIHFIVTAEQTSAIPAKVLSLFTERFALKLSEIGEYGNIVGRGVTAITDAPGRGYLSYEGRPLEFQTLLPVVTTEKQRTSGIDETKALAEFAEQIKAAWIVGQSSNSSKMPAPIHVLPPLVTLESILLDNEVEPNRFSVPIGIDDRSLQPLMIDLSQLIHAVVSGSQLSGKTSTLWTWILGLTHQFSPDELGIVLIDSIGFLNNYRGQHTLGDLPHVLQTVAEPEQMKTFTAHLAYEYETLTADETQQRELFVFIDNFDDFNDLDPDIELLTRLTRNKPGRKPIHFIVCGTPMGLQGGSDFLRRITQSRFGIACNLDAVSETPHNANVPRSLRDAELPIGRGFTIRSGIVSVVQLALPYSLDNRTENGIDIWVERIQDRWLNVSKAEWLTLPEDYNTGDTTLSTAEDESDGADNVPPNPAQVEAAKAALEPILDSVILSHLPPSELVELARSYGLLDDMEVQTHE